MTSTEVGPALRVIPLDVHSGIAKAHQDRVALVVLDMDAKLLGAIRRAKRLIQDSTNCATIGHRLLRRLLLTEKIIES